jgi:hypothetical protein
MRDAGARSGGKMLSPAFAQVASYFAKASAYAKATADETQDKSAGRQRKAASSRRTPKRPLGTP